MSSGIDIKVGASTKGLNTGLQVAKHKIRDVSASMKAESAVMAQGQKELAAAQKEVADAIAKVSAAQREELQLLKLKAQAAEDDQTAELLQREIRLREETNRLARDLGIADHEAYAVAQERIALEDQVSAVNKRRADASLGVLEADKKVEHQMVGLVQSLTAVDSAGDAVGATFSALASSLHLTLGAAVAAGAGIAIGSKLNEAREEAEKLNESLQKILQPQGSFEFKALSNLESRLDNLKGKLGELSEGQGFWGQLSEGFDEMFGAIDETGDQRRTRQLSDVRTAIEQTKSDVAGKVGQENDVLRLENNGEDRAAELAKIAHEYAEKRGAAIAQQNDELLKQLKIQEQLKVDAVNKKYDDDHAQKMSAIADQQAAEVMENSRNEARVQQALANQQADQAEQRKEQAKEIEGVERQIGYASREVYAEILGKISKRLELTEREALLAQQIADIQKQIADADDPQKAAALKQELNSATLQGIKLTQERKDLEDSIAKLARETAYVQMQGEIDRMPASQAIEKSKMQQALYEIQIAGLAKEALTADELRKGEIDKQTAALYNQIEAQKQLRRQQFIDDKKAGPHGRADRKDREREDGKLQAMAKRAEEREAKEQAQKEAREIKPAELPWRNKRTNHAADRRRKPDGIHDGGGNAARNQLFPPELVNTLTGINASLSGIAGKVGVAR